MIPAFAILADGADATAKIADRLLSLEITDEDGERADSLRLELDDRDGRIAWPDMQAELEVRLGYLGGALSMMGRYRIEGLSGGGPRMTLSIDAKAVDMKGQARGPRTRAWRGKTLGDIVATIAGEAGLKPVVGESIAGTAWDYLAQTAESDLHFLARITKPLDATAKPAGAALIVQRRGEGKTAAGDTISPVALTPAELSAWRWTLNGRQKYLCVEAAWSDIGAGQERLVVCGEGEPKRRLRHVYASEAEARRAAQGELDQGNREALKLSADLAGFNPGLFAGGTVSLSGLRAELAGEWQVTRVAHRLSGGLATSFDARRAG